MDNLALSQHLQGEKHTLKEATVLLGRNEDRQSDEGEFIKQRQEYYNGPVVFNSKI